MTERKDRSMTDNEVWQRTALQEELAKTGQAEGQCSHCGSYRADGAPPILHQPDCPSAVHMDGYEETFSPLIPPYRL